LNFMRHEKFLSTENLIKGRRVAVHGWKR
jgi:hypothetical protein